MTNTTTCCSTVALEERATAPLHGAAVLTIVGDARVAPETVLAVLAEYEALDDALAGQLQGLAGDDATARERAGAEDAESVAAVLARLAAPVNG